MSRIYVFLVGKNKKYITSHSVQSFTKKERKYRDMYDTQNNMVAFIHASSLKEAEILARI